MSYSRLLSHYRAFLAAGFMLCFFSGFGQTYFISAFTPALLDKLALGQAGFGLLYAGATLASAALLPWIGSRLDRSDGVRYAQVTCAGFALACVLLALVSSPWHLALALFGLRFCGQGLFTHIAMTVTARGFSSLRGRALSLVGLGHPVSEAILPLLAVALLAWLGWRGTWLIFAVSLLLLLPTLSSLLRGPVQEDTAQFASTRQACTTTDSASLALREPAIPAVVRSGRFWFLVAGMVLPGTLLTALFLYHGVLAQTRGWSTTWMAAGFAWFALAQVLFSLVGGVVVDRWGARTVFTVYLVPLALGLGLLMLPTASLWVVPAYLFLAGVTNGLASPMKTAIWAEHYGSAQLATLRSWATAAGVMGSALGAPVLGVMLDAGLGFTVFLGASIGLVLVYCALASLAKRRGYI